MSVFILNSGSTSLKFGVFDSTGEPRLQGVIDWAHGDRSRARLTVKGAARPAEERRVAVPTDLAAARCAIDSTFAGGCPASEDRAGITAIGHRLVHGGIEFRESTRITPNLKSALTRLGSLAPLHNPPALAMIEAMEQLLPSVPQVAVFDTAFYAGLPPETYLYPVPYAWYERWGIRRFGFHGLSHSYCSERAAELLGDSNRSLRLVSCHLGGGCSATAILGRVPVATTMGFSPLDGIMMGTRPGSLDPGILLHLQREHGLSFQQIDTDLNEGSGLAGVSGISGDLAAIEAADAAGNPRAHVAFKMFAAQLRSAIGSLATSMGGLDAITFTDRIGEQSSALRAAVCEPLGFVGVRIDQDKNRKAVADCDIAAPDSAVRILVLRTQEEKMVARETWKILRR